VLELQYDDIERSWLDGKTPVLRGKNQEQIMGKKRSRIAARRSRSRENECMNVYVI